MYEDITHFKNLESQTKLALMGEMIGNIAHQWRQPLSIISTGASGLKIRKEFDNLTDQFFFDTCDMINNNAQYLSTTIEDFKNFIKGDTVTVQFKLSENIESFIKLVESVIKKNQINIVQKYEDDITIVGYPNELKQCFINLFNNSKDAFIENNIDEGERYIFIKQSQDNENIIITFKDNAKGIPESILDRIFEPYFTTKHQSVGTGIGLHMTHTLIVNSMKGEIKVQNKEYNYNGKQYKGAKFTITLPKKTNSSVPN
jgi:signal transduction histidine kinase